MDVKEKKALADALTNANGAKVRKSPVPSDPKRIFDGALNMTLKEKVELRNKLTDSITAEVADMERRFKEGVELINTK